MFCLEEKIMHEVWYHICEEEELWKNEFVEIWERKEKIWGKKENLEI